jgi:hypothetical protein
MMNKMLPQEPFDADEQLAEFTNQVLAGEKNVEKDKIKTGTDLDALKETIIRLKTAFGEDELTVEESTRMHKQILARYQKSQKEPRVSSWKKWLQNIGFNQTGWRSTRKRQNAILAVSLFAIIIIILIGMPFFLSNTSSLPASAGLQPQGIIAVIILGILAIISVWLWLRHK